MLCKKKYIFFQIFFVLLLYRLGVSRSFSMFKFNYTVLFDVFIYATRIQKGSKMHFKFWNRIRPNFLDPTGSGSTTLILSHLYGKDYYAFNILGAFELKVVSRDPICRSNSSRRDIKHKAFRI